MYLALLDRHLESRRVLALQRRQSDVDSLLGADGPRALHRARVEVQVEDFLRLRRADALVAFDARLEALQATEDDHQVLERFQLHLVDGFALVRRADRQVVLPTETAAAEDIAKVPGDAHRVTPIDGVLCGLTTSPVRSRHHEKSLQVHITGYENL